MNLGRVAALVALFSIATVRPAPAAPAGNPLLLSFGRGASERRSDQLPWRPLARGSQPTPGAEVRCRSGCSSRLLWGGTAIAAPDAIISTLRPGYLRPPWLASAQPIARLGLREGMLHVALGESSRAALAVEAPGLTVLARTGRVDIVARQDRIAVAAVDDDVWVQRGAGWIPLAAGTVLVSKPGESASSHPLVTPPAWANNSDGRAPIELSPSGGPVPVGARWSAARGAERYRFQIARDASFAAVLETTVTPPGQTTLESAPLPPGAYFARVFSVDTEGIESAPSAALELRVARMALPPGAFIDAANRTVTLGATQGIRLTAAEGLEVADGRGFAEPPAEILLGSGEIRLVSLRLRDDHAAQVALLLKRWRLRADVAFTPHLPMWPRDPLTVEVSIIDPGGRVDTAAIKPELHVLLGLDEVPVTWTQRGAGWIGQIPPRPLLADAMMQVVVSDGCGGPLGQAFVEIASDARPPAAMR